MTRARQVVCPDQGTKWGRFGMALVVALMAGCAVPAERKAAAPADRPAKSASSDKATASAATQQVRPQSATAARADSTAGTVTEKSAAVKLSDEPQKSKAPSEPKPGPVTAGTPEPKPEATRDGPRSQIDTDRVNVSTEAERDALAEMIKSAAIQAQQEAAERQPPPSVPPPAPVQKVAPPATAPVAVPEVAASTGTPHMELSPAEFDFKEVWQGMPAEGEFKIRNTGTGPLTLDTRSSCGCTVATKPQSPLAPGEETSFKISYNTSQPGPAQKTVTVATNDPQQPAVIIRVTGTVKALIVATPKDRIYFNDLEPDSVESQTIRIEPKYDTPINLRLRENQNFGPFTVALKEVEPGKLYELTATTKPPLPTPAASGTALLETGVEKVPTIPIQMTAIVPPRVSVSPPQLVIPPTASQPMEQFVQVQCRGATPAEITEVKCTAESVKWEVLPPNPAAEGAKLRVQRVRVTLPAYSDLPAEGASLQIFTSDPEERYKRVDVRIIKVRAPAPRNIGAAGH